MLNDNDIISNGTFKALVLSSIGLSFAWLGYRTFYKKNTYLVHWKANNSDTNIESTCTLHTQPSNLMNSVTQFALENNPDLNNKTDVTFEIQKINKL